ncbi:DUF2314 domain-containing protein [Mesorhizobium sp. M0621]|uniref:YegJ family protein n=1 Tax=Mesorhizobium sp. M0621 TaxID=2956974 RepID=UPI00333B1B78
MNFRKQYHRLNSDTLPETDTISSRFGFPNERTSVREKSRLAGLWQAAFDHGAAAAIRLGRHHETDRWPVTSTNFVSPQADGTRAPVANRERMQDGVNLYDEGGPSMKLTVQTMISLMLMLALAPGSAGAQGADPGDDKTAIFTPGDPDMAAATAQALASLDDFLALSVAPPSGTDRFKLKVKVRDGNVTEHFWVIPFRRTETGFVGILANQPEGVHNVVLGQNIEFTRDDISDWGYRRDGRQVGSFTVCVMFKKMSKEEADYMHDQYGFDC